MHHTSRGGEERRRPQRPEAAAIGAHSPGSAAATSNCAWSAAAAGGPACSIADAEFLLDGAGEHLGTRGSDPFGAGYQQTLRRRSWHRRTSRCRTPHRQSPRHRSRHPGTLARRTVSGRARAGTARWIGVAAAWLPAVLGCACPLRLLVSCRSHAPVDMAIGGTWGGWPGAWVSCTGRV